MGTCPMLTWLEASLGKAKIDYLAVPSMDGRGKVKVLRCADAPGAGITTFCSFGFSSERFGDPASPIAYEMVTGCRGDYALQKLVAAIVDTLRYKRAEPRDG